MTVGFFKTSNYINFLRNDSSAHNLKIVDFLRTIIVKHFVTDSQSELGERDDGNAQIAL